MKAKSFSGNPNTLPCHSAFTLVDLLAVLAAAGLLSCFLLPALAGSGTDPRAFQCLKNLKQLGVAWRAYTEDFSDRFVNNFGLDGVLSEVNRKTYQSWVNNVMDWTPTSLNTNLVPVANGILARYTGSDVGVYRCPADTYLSPVQRAAGWSARARSYSMNGFFGPYDTNPNGTWASGRNPFFTSYRQWLKCPQVLHPARAWVFIEEHPDSINDGYFVNDPNPAGSWGDQPASFHNGACGLAFADGHLEMHRWLSPKTKFPVRYYYQSQPPDPVGRTDYQWLMARTAVPY